jgi:hypothetical protein
MKFGDRLMNVWAGEGNPHRFGYFVRRGNKASGINKGPWIELTDKKGDFWKSSPENLIPA